MLDYILLRLDDYAEVTSDRNRRMGSIALQKNAAGRVANTLTTNLNDEFNKKKKDVVRELRKHVPSSPSHLRQRRTSKHLKAAVSAERLVNVALGAGGLDAGERSESPPASPGGAFPEPKLVGRGRGRGRGHAGGA